MFRPSLLRLSAALLLALCLAGCTPAERATADQEPLWPVDDFSLVERSGKRASNRAPSAPCAVAVASSVPSAAEACSNAALPSSGPRSAQ